MNVKVSWDSIIMTVTFAAINFLLKKAILIEIVLLSELTDCAINQ